ncbi:MAG: phage holin family protein [Anaerolineales bacterium]
MNRFILRWLINAVALYAAVALLSGRGITPIEGATWLSYAGLALIFGFLNAFLRPLLYFLTCLLNILTLGLFTLIINTFLFWLTGVIGATFHIGFLVDNFWAAFLGGLIVSVVSMVLTMILKDEMKKSKDK